MHEQDRTAPVHLGIDRLELGLGDRASEARDVHVDPDAPKLIEPSLHLAQRRVDMRQRQHDVGRDPPRVALRQFGITIVQQMQRLHALASSGR